MIMITRKEYDKALDLINAYHRQLMIDKMNSSINLFDWLKIIKKEKHISTRLHNILNEYNKHWSRNPSDRQKIFIDDIDKDMFMKFRNAGSKTWKEFVELRGY